MTSAQTTTTIQNSGHQTSPFDQIQELEQREMERLKKEISAMAKEKEEIIQSMEKKEEQATEELKNQAKKDLKKYSETELSTILANAQKESDEECKKLEAIYKSREASVIQTLVSKASDVDFLFQTSA